MHVIEWKEPALFWNGSVNDLGRPRLLEIRNDEFVPVFLQAMMKPDPAPFLQQHQIDAVYSPNQPVKLYQPLHGCYYLVTASLVCRQVGLPDKAINQADGETISFVIRRLALQGEEAWIPEGQGGSWKPVASIQDLMPGEERFPMHPVTVCSKPDAPRSVFTDNVERDLHYGYIPTGNRDKYNDTVARTDEQTVSPETFVDDFMRQAEEDVNSEPGIDYSFRMDLFVRRVYQPWASLMRRIDSFPTAAPTDATEQQLYLLLELGDFLKNNLPTLWESLVDEGSDGASLPPGMQALFDMISDDLEVDGTDGGSLRDVLRTLEAHFDAIRGDGDLPDVEIDVTDTFSGLDDTPPQFAEIDAFQTEIESAVTDETQPIQLPDGEDAEIVNLIRNQVQPLPDEEQVYVIRTVYEYDPECPPIMSALPSQPFSLARFFDPDAPARLVRLEAPSIRPQDLRKFARGVGIEMSPELHNLTSSLTGEDAQDVIDSMGGGGLSIQMVCTFSIQIIFLVAFIVMFIFLIALNFIFWWLAFLRICLPIPRRA